MKKPFSALLLWAAAVYLFLYVPIAAMAVNSLNASKFPQSWGGFTLKWYAEMFRDAEILRALFTSLWIAGASSLVATVLGTLAALGMRGEISRRNSGRGGQRLSARNWIESLLMVPVILPDIVIGISLLLLFVFARMQLGRTTVVLAHVTFSMVYVFLVVRVRLKGMDASLEEAARDLGATASRAFFSVTLPLILPGVMAGALLAFTLSFEDFLITFFTAGVGTTTLPVRIYSMTKFGVSPVVSALSTAFLALVILATLASARWKVRRE